MTDSSGNPDSDCGLRSAPQSDETPSGVGRDTLGPEISSQGRTQPPHPTCVDVTRFGSPPGSEWMCGPGCPVIHCGIGASIVLLDTPEVPA